MLESSYNLDEDVTLRGFRPGERVFQKRYTLQKILGRGGMGVVWLAVDESLQTEVALKFLPDVLVRDQIALADLKRETKQCLALTHPHIVRVHHFEEDSAHGAAAIAMEYVSGGSLSNLRAEREPRHFEVDEIREWVLQLCDALDYAHTKAKVVHLDIKPANLMLDGNRELKVADFGISRNLADSVSRVSVKSGASISGTLAYMSPQQALGEPARLEDDIYAFGATVYDLLTGRPPFFRGEIYEQLRSVTPPGIAERRRELGVQGSDIPWEWESTILACLEKNPGDRPSGMREVAGRLRANASATAASAAESGGGHSAENPPKAVAGLRGMRGFAGLALGLVAVGALSVWGWRSWGPESRGDAGAKVSQKSAPLARGSLNVESVPSGLQFELHSLDRNAPGESGLHMVSPFVSDEIPAGRYEIKWQREGWPDRRDEVEVMPDAPASVRRVWEESLVRISTEPPGLQMELDGGVPFTSPQTVALAQGEHRLRVLREGWPEVRETRVLAQGENPEWRVEFGEASLKLTSNLDSASYEMFAQGAASGQPASPGTPDFSGTLPSTLPRVPSGRYSVVFTRDGWGKQVQEVSLGKGERGELAAKFPAATLLIGSTPPGAVVSVDGASLGPAPLERIVPPGVHVVRMELKGRTPVERRVSVEDAQRLLVDEKFPVASIEIVSDPAGAVVFLDGKVVGKTPFLAPDLVPGAYRWTLMRKGSLPASVEAQLVEGGAVKKSIRLEEARFAGSWKSQAGVEITGLSQAVAKELQKLSDGPIEVSVDEKTATLHSFESAAATREESVLRWSSLLSEKDVRIEYKCSMDVAGVFRAELKGEASGKKLQGKMSGRFVREPEEAR